MDGLEGLFALAFHPGFATNGHFVVGYNLNTTTAAGTLATPQLVERFKAEAEAAASLSHPNTVPIHEIGEHQGQHYFSMGLIEGPNLREALRQIRNPKWE